MPVTSPSPDQAQRLPWQARLPIFFGWVIVAVVFLRAFTTAGAIWSTAVLSVPMQEDLGWSQSSIFFGITLRTLGAAVGGFFLGRFLDSRRGAPIMAVGSAFVSGFGIMAVSFVTEVWQFWIIFGLFSGLLGAGPGALMQAAIVPKWFVRKRGRATALASMGTGLAAFLLPFTVANVVEAVDWRNTYLLLGGMTLVFAVLPALLIKTRPEDVGLRTDGDKEGSEAAARARAADQSLTAGEAFRTTTLWLLVGAVFFASFSPTAFPANLTPTFSSHGFDLRTAGLAFSAYGFTSFFGRFFWGWLADRIHIRKTLLIVCAWNGLTVPLLLLLPGRQRAGCRRDCRIRHRRLGGPQPGSLGNLLWPRQSRLHCWPGASPYHPVRRHWAVPCGGDGRLLWRLRRRHHRHGAELVGSVPVPIHRPPRPTPCAC